MRAYCVHTTEPEIVYFVGSEVEARQFRMRLMEEHKLKRKEITIDLVEIPTGKAELLSWINSRETRKP
jgi:hypothetical protein